jgi:hypothetical protein
MGWLWILRRRRRRRRREEGVDEKSEESVMRCQRPPG